MLLLTEQNENRRRVMGVGPNTWKRIWYQKLVRETCASFFFW